jgi:hypothetical protein
MDYVFGMLTLMMLSFYKVFSIGLEVVCSVLVFILLVLRVFMEGVNIRFLGGGGNIRLVGGGGNIRFFRGGGKLIEGD